MIVGMGKTGLSCARFLRARGEAFLIIDDRAEPPGLAELQREFPGQAYQLGEFREATLLGARRLIVSPGVSLAEPALVRARKAGVPISGDIDMFSQLTDVPIVAVTGSNGKSTVVSLVAEICRAAAINYGLGGNLDGERARPALDLLQEPTRDLYVLELSSFQLETTENLRAEVAVLLNLSEDHMDRYTSLESYLDAKQRIFRGARKLVVNRDSLFSEPLHRDGRQVVDFGLGEPAAGNFGVREVQGVEYLACGERKLFPRGQLKLAGRHNLANVLAAMAIGAALEIDLDTICRAVREFRGLPNRCQWVAEIGGVSFYNDSKGTNVGATVAAIEGLGDGLPGRLILIAGGLGKGADFSPLQPVVAKFVSSVILLGTAAREIATALAESVPTSFAVDMQQAVTLAKEQARPGDVVLLSPACASYDMYRDFNHRGQVFTEAVRSLS